MPDSTQPMSVLFTHTDFVIISKPAGMDFHGRQAEEGYILGVTDWAAKALNIEKLWAVHRLDKMTSGLLILAKSAESAAKFGKMFQARTIQKYYLALANQKPKKKQGWIKADMVAARRGNFKLLPSKNNPAITQFISASILPKLRLFLLKPYTGKTHQLRVAMKSLGAPILGDHRYQNAQDASQFDRGYLHAFALEFYWNDEKISIHEIPSLGELFLIPETQEKIQQWIPAGNYFNN